MRNTTGRSRNINRKDGGWPRTALPLVLLVAAVLLPAACADQGQATTAPGGVIVQTPVGASPAARSTPTMAPTAIPPTPTPPAPLAATVNGHYVFLADYERRAAQYEQVLLAQGLDATTEDGKARLAAMRQEVLDSLVNNILVEQETISLGVSLAEEEVEAQVVADIEAGGGQGAFTEWLTATGQTRDDYKASLREAMLWQRVMDAVSSQIPAAAEQVHVRHIIVDTREAADRVQAQLQAGADFSRVARESSLDVATKDNGGDLGWFPRGLVDPDLEAVAFSLQPGEIAGPIEFVQGFRFLQVIERQGDRAIPPEMQLDIKRAAFERWLEEQRQAAEIEQFVDTGN